MTIEASLPYEIKKHIFSFLDKRCFRCKRVMSFIRKESYYYYYPSINSRDNTKYTVCNKCYFELDLIRRFSSSGVISYG